MVKSQKGFTSVDEYIAGFPKDVQLKLQQIRRTVLKVAPGSEEVISYQMPAFKFHGVLVYFAAYSKHIGFYPTGSGIEAFKDELSDYKWAKGSVQFPLHQPLPLALIKKMVQFRVEENLKKQGA